MFLPKTHIHLDVDDAGESAAFYEALLGAPPARRSEMAAVFVFDSPPLVLTLETPPVRRPARRRHRSNEGFALLVAEPAHVGHAAIALRRAGVRLRVEDEGIEAHDPDGTPWQVRFAPKVRGRSVVASRGRGDDERG
jgi:catechol 2,3-dioxygenase-like lactoylglutathione lyase family enzyme